MCVCEVVCMCPCLCVRLHVCVCVCAYAWNRRSIGLWVWHYVCVGVAYVLWKPEPTTTIAWHCRRFPVCPVGGADRIQPEIVQLTGKSPTRSEASNISCTILALQCTRLTPKDLAWTNPEQWGSRSEATRVRSTKNTDFYWPWWHHKNDITIHSYYWLLHHYVRTGGHSSSRAYIKASRELPDGLPNIGFVGLTCYLRAYIWIANYTCFIFLICYPAACYACDFNTSKCHMCINCPRDFALSPHRPKL